MESEFNNLEKMLTIKKAYNKFLTDNKLVPSFVIFAKALEEHDYNSQQELTAYIACNKAHTSRTLLKMQMAGLIKPIYKKIALTEKGKQFVEKVNEVNKQFEEKLFAGISENDLKTFVKVMNQFSTNIKVFK